MRGGVFAIYPPEDKGVYGELLVLLATVRLVYQS